MSNANTGGPAFPAPEAGQQHFSDPSVYLGMTLRDYFAAKAMQGFCADPNMPSVEKTVEIAYAVADAMMKARES